MKRNKRTDKVCHQDLSPVTERILAKMGSEGLKIRRRLQTFYQERTELGERETRRTGLEENPEAA